MQNVLQLIPWYKVVLAIKLIADLGYGLNLKQHIYGHEDDLLLAV